MSDSTDPTLGPATSLPPDPQDKGAVVAAECNTLTFNETGKPIAAFFGGANSTGDCPLAALLRAFAAGNGIDLSAPSGTSAQTDAVLSAAASINAAAANLAAANATIAAAFG